MANATIEAPTTLLKAVAYFADQDRAFDFVASIRWPDGNVTCPRCGTGHPSFISTRQVWKCKGCHKQFSLKVGTIFEDSPLGWDKWVPAVWLLANSKNSVSSHELGRALGVTQKTAWFMLHRIRDAMETDRSPVCLALSKSMRPTLAVSPNSCTRTSVPGCAALVESTR
jgi:transposase-like protein